MRIEDDAVADNRQLAPTPDGRSELVDLAVDDKRMARVVAALYHDIGTLRQPVDDLALPSSPHCEPTTTTLAIILPFDLPSLRAAHANDRPL